MTNGIDAPASPALTEFDSRGELVSPASVAFGLVRGNKENNKIYLRCEVIRNHVC